MMVTSCESRQLRTAVRGRVAFLLVVEDAWVAEVAFALVRIGRLSFRHDRVDRLDALLNALARPDAIDLAQRVGANAELARDHPGELLVAAHHVAVRNGPAHRQ